MTRDLSKDLEMGDGRRMEFWITLAGLVRRKRVIVPAVLVAVTLGLGAFLLTPVSYVSSTTMVLTTTEYGGTESRDPAKPTDLTNPMLNFNESLTTTSAILIEAMNTKSVATQLGVKGRTRLVIDDGRTNPNLLGLNGPFLYIVAQSTSPDNAEHIVKDAQTLMREKLRDWQNALNAPEKTYVSLVDVVPPSTPEADRSRAIKYGVLAFIAGLGLSMTIAYLAHQLRARRRGRGTTAAPSAQAPPDTNDPAIEVADRSHRPAVPTDHQANGSGQSGKQATRQIRRTSRPSGRPSGPKVLVPNASLDDPKPAAPPIPSKKARFRRR